SFIDAFRKADEVLFQAVKGISDLITQNGIVNVDFADVKTVMNSMGRALMGTGIAKGNNRARLAAEMAISSPLLDDISVDGAAGGPVHAVRAAGDAVRPAAEPAHGPPLACRACLAAPGLPAAAGAGLALQRECARLLEPPHPCPRGLPRDPGEHARTGARAR